MSTQVEERKLDRLSNLPHPIIYHILSLMNTKYAVQTCVLSKEWRLHWTHIHSLNFYFSRRGAFGKLILHILQRRRPFKLRRLSLYSANPTKPPPYTKNILQYAISHGVKELETDLADIPPFFYKCQTLETLKLQKASTCRCWYFNKINSNDFASLSTLELHELVLRDENNNHDIFSNHLNLKNLKLGTCYVRASENFTLVSSSVVYLKISSLCHHDYSPKAGKIVISAPRLEILELNVSNNVELEIYKCQVLRKMNIPRPPVAWTIVWKQEYFSYMKIMNGGYHLRKPVELLSFNFFKDQFLSYNISANTGNTIKEIDEVEGKCLWFYDGETVWQSIPGYKVN